jgi:23S rRNA (adenine1618-N6)-methyltransferase
MRNDKRRGLHPNNPHRGRYNIEALTKTSPELKEFIIDNPIGDKTINFSDDSAVLALNRALLKKYYNIDNWSIPQGFLCPPVPGRADYIHYISDLIKEEPENTKILDIGTGANLIYPIIGSQTFNWHFRASDIDPESIDNCKKIIEENDTLKKKIDIVLQENKSFIFDGIIKKDDFFEVSMCNPPFHGSLKEAQDSNRKKVHNLNKNRATRVDESLNFGGQKAELWCPGGEMFFLKKMVKESANFADQVRWFTSLISKSDNIKPVKKYIRKAGATRTKVIEMSQGNKISRIVAWSFIE